MTEVEDRYGTVLRFTAKHDRQAADRIVEHVIERTPDREETERRIRLAEGNPQTGKPPGGTWNR